MHSLFITAAEITAALPKTPDDLGRIRETGPATNTRAGEERNIWFSKCSEVE